MDYIIVQAGGKGTRLKYLTENKPKAIVPVENLPMLFHLFRKYPDKRFIIVADYKKKILRRYLSSFADVKYQIVEASGEGTCGGVKQAISLLPDNESFMLIWSDLILPAEFKLPQEYEDNNGKECTKDYVGISSTFPCRWKYENGRFEEERSSVNGVAGVFLFRNKAILEKVPKSGELVRWMQEQDLNFTEWSIAGTREFGLLEEYERLNAEKTRPFNRITIEGDVLIKEPVDDQGRTLAKRECAWYKKAMEKQVSGIPRIFETEPLRMELIHGKNIYELSCSAGERKEILKKLVNILNELHRLDRVPADSFSMREAYFDKTIKRLSLIEDLVPFGRDKYIRVNGRLCRNVYFFKDKLEQALNKLEIDHFSFIHGDCTFSNLMVRDDGEPVFIDPRGYFGFTELYGDERYDWAKLYYSIVGNYDRFNLKKFKLKIGSDADDGVALSVESNGWEDMEEEFFTLTGTDPWEIRLLYAVIWLSLTTYAWQDYDSVCGAFYNGIYYLEDVL